jgi:hypothetical protein
VIIGMPGEAPKMGCNECVHFAFPGAAYITFDNFLLYEDDDTAPLPLVGGAFYAQTASLVDHITIRNIEMENWMQHVRFQSNPQNLLYEYLIMRDHGNASHGTYDSCWSDNGCDGHVIRGVIAYSTPLSATGAFMQWGSHATATRKWTNLVIEKSIFHTARQWALSLQNNHDGTIIRNNIFFNNNRWDIQFYNYSGNFGFDNCKIINNTFYRGSTNNGNGSEDPSSYYSIKLEDLGSDADNVVIRNNAMHRYDGVGLINTIGSKNIGNWTIENNIFYKETGDSTVALIDAVTKTSTQLDAYGSVSNMDYSDPYFEDVSINYYDDAWSFKLDLTSSSTNAIDGGVDTNDPSDDLRGNPRPLGSDYDVGAYEFKISTPISPSAPKNLRIVSP